MDKVKKKKHKQDAPEQADAEQSAPTVEEEGASGAAPPVEPEQKQEDEALEMRLLRLQADFDNFRKRTARERIEWQRVAKEDILKDILPVLDHYELGLNTAINHHVEQSVLNGFQMVYDQFLAALRQHQVTPIEAEGEPFDHNVHEAITYVPSEEQPAHTVIVQTRRGYRIGDKMLRAAQVVVSSGPAEAEQPAPVPANEEEQTR